MKRILSLLLCAILFAGNMPFVCAASMTASRECIALLKEEEGFNEYPYWDHSQWTVGYGTRCPDDLLEYYRTSGIEEQAAEDLLQSHLRGLYVELNRFADKHSLKWTQNQFDALVLFSYNCGTGWIYEQTGIFHNAIRQMATGNELIRSFSLWCSAGGQVQEYLLRRRLSEANLWLNGIYSQTPPENYCYVLYDANGGTVSVGYQGYDGEQTAAPYPTATYAGYIFDGWYTHENDGERIAALDTSTDGLTLYAHWKEAAVVEERAVSKQLTTEALRGTVWVNGFLWIRNSHSAGYFVIAQMNTNDRTQIPELESAPGQDQRGSDLYGRYENMTLKWRNWMS